MSVSQQRVPVAILTGFLGAGKSSLLNRILKDEAMRDAAVIINEFGDVGIDHLLVESSGDAIIELSDGCLCCTVRGELVDTLANLMDAMQTGRIRPLKRVVIETTGLADPERVGRSRAGKRRTADGSGRRPRQRFPRDLRSRKGAASWPTGRRPLRGSDQRDRAMDAAGEVIFRGAAKSGVTFPGRCAAR